MKKLSIILSIISLITSIITLTFILINNSKSAEKIFNKSLNSVVELKATTADLESFGSAVILSNNELVTNFHVISFTSQSITYIHTTIEIRFSNSNDYQEVTLKHYDSKLDLALLELTSSSGVPFKTNSLKIETGQQVYLLGNANNLGISITSGIISKNEVEISFNENTNRYIQIDATSTNGISGGALLNNSGKIIGIITLRLLDNEGIPIYGYVYAIPVDLVLEFMKLIN